MEILVLLNFSIFILISALHFYWFFGGQWAATAVLPERIDGTRLFIPGKFATLFVAFGLLCFALVMLANLKQVNAPISDQAIQLANWFTVLVFAARAIGDFRYVGFSKRVKHTRFARYDSVFYSPLCLLITIITLLILLVGM